MDFLSGVSLLSSAHFQFNKDLFFSAEGGSNPGFNLALAAQPFCSRARVPGVAVRGGKNKRQAERTTSLSPSRLPRAACTLPGSDQHLTSTYRLGPGVKPPLTSPRRSHKYLQRGFGRPCSCRTDPRRGGAEPPLQNGRAPFLEKGEAEEGGWRGKLRQDGKLACLRASEEAKLVAQRSEPRLRSWCNNPAPRPAVPEQRGRGGGGSLNSGSCLLPTLPGVLTPQEGFCKSRCRFC